MRYDPFSVLHFYWFIVEKLFFNKVSICFDDPIVELRCINKLAMKQKRKERSKLSLEKGNVAFLISF